MANHKPEFLGVDVGAARVGIARGNDLAKLAEPLKTVAADQAITLLQQLATQNEASAIVVGLPRSLDGNETQQTKSVRLWVEQAKDQIKLPFFWQDEAASTISAQASHNPAGIDAAAAAVILQDFLDSSEDDRAAV